MTFSDLVLVIAVFVAPIFAVQVQMFVDIIKEKRDRKMRIFKTLMATRATTLSASHIEALNMIDIEFYKNKDVVSIWKLRLDNFNNYPQDEQSSDYRSKLNACVEKSNDLLVDLLYEMSKVLKYDFDKLLIKRGCYIPIAHNQFEEEQAIIRKGFAGVFLGKNTLPISIIEK